MEEFSCMTRIISGGESTAVLRQWSGKQVFLVTQSHLRQSGTDAAVLPLRSFRETVYWEVPGEDASMQQAVAGSQTLKTLQPDLVIALGERHVLDCAKAMVCFSGISCPLAVVPSLPGSGTEVTSRVCLRHDGRLHQLRNEGMRPAYAILEASLAAAASRRRIAEEGFLLLSNALESCAARNAGVLTDLAAREAFCSTWAALSGAVAGSTSSWIRLQTASCLSGMALDHAGLGLCHALAGSLETVCHLPEGKLAAILLPAVISCNCHASGHKYAVLARSAGMAASSEAVAVSRLRAGLIRLRRDLGLPATLAQAGADPRSIRCSLRRIAQLTLEDPECPNNPLTVDDFMIRRILEEVTGRS